VARRPLCVSGSGHWSDCSCTFHSEDSKSTYNSLERDELAAFRKLGPQRTGPVFLSYRGDKIARRTVQHFVAEAGVAARLPFMVHPHMPRHFCGHSLTARRGLTRLVQDWLGHRNIRHTEQYTTIDPERYRGRGKGLWSSLA
jgi:site-specific recombinase XerC